VPWPHITQEIAMEKVNLAEKFALVSEHWQPKIVGELNGQGERTVEQPERI
jgi:hypothetical protein